MTHAETFRLKAKREYLLRQLTKLDRDVNALRAKLGLKPLPPLQPRKR